MDSSSKYALAVGVGEYCNVPAADIPVAAADAVAISEVLCDPSICGYTSKQVTVLTNRDATKKKILDAIKNLHTVRQTDTVVLFYCGHGAKDQQGKYCLTTHDSLSDGDCVVSGTGINETELFTHLKYIRASRVLVIINACFSGELSDTRTLMSPSTTFTSSSPPKQVIDDLSRAQARVLITASMPHEKSHYDTRLWPLTLFTHTLVDGLRNGKIKSNADYISVFTLFEYLETTVAELAKAHNWQQKPELTSLEMKGAFPFAFNTKCGQPGYLGTEMQPGNIVAPKILHRPVPFGAPLIGRDALLSTLKQILFCQDPPHDWVTLTGLNGIGKTTLSLVLSYDGDVVKYFRDGILWAELGRNVDVMAELNFWATELNIPYEEMKQLTTIEQKKRRIHMALADRQMLLVVDDVWQAELPSHFRVGGEKCVRLFTTQFPSVALDVIGPRQTPIEVPSLTEEESLEMLGTFAPEALEGFEEEALALVRAVEGLPLALELIGKYLRETYLYNRKNLAVAYAKLRQVQGRHEVALQHIVSVVYKALSNASQSVLRDLSVLPPKPSTFSQDAAFAVTGSDSFEVMYPLLSCGFLVSEESSGRYFVRKVVRDYVLAIAGEQPIDAHRNMVSYFLNFVRSKTGDWQLFHKEHANLCEAIEHAEGESLVHFAIELYPYWEASGLYDLAMKHLRRALDVAADKGHEEARAMVLLCLGRSAIRCGQNPQAKEYLDKGIEVARQTNNDILKVDILHAQTLLALNRSDILELNRFIRSGLRIAQRIDYRQGMGRLLFIQGFQAWNDGLFGKVISLFQESHEIAKSFDDFDDQTLTGINLVMATADAVQFGGYRSVETEKVISILQDCLAQARQKGHVDRTAFGLATQAYLEMQRHDWLSARNHLYESLKLTEGTCNHYLHCIALDYLGSLATATQETDEAFKVYNECLCLGQQYGYPEHVANAYWGLAKLAQQSGDLDVALAQAALALKKYKVIHSFKSHIVAAWLKTVQQSGIAN